MEFSASTRAVSGAAVLEVSGEVDMATEEDFGRAIRDAINAAGNPGIVVLDLRGVEFMAACGVRTVSEATRGFCENGGKVKAAVKPGEVAEILDLMGAGRYLETYPDAASAVKGG